MTITVAPATSTTDAPRPRRRITSPWVPALVLAALTAVLRLVGIGAAQPISVDEMFYMNLGNSVAKGRIPPNYPAGEGNVHQVFLLHPPGFFMLEALWESIVGRPSAIIAQVVRARELNSVVAVVTVVLIFLLARRLVGTRAGIAAGLLFALDPFIIRQNGQVLLETSTLMWVLAGLLVLLPIVQGDSRRPRAAAAAGGLLLGVAFLTKDMVAIETVGVLVVLLVTGWALPRRLALWSLVGSVVPYAIYVVACAAQGYFGSLVSSKTSGIRRVLGLSVSTGFNAKGAPSLGGTLIAQLLTFVFSYALVAVGTLCGLWLLRSKRPDHRLIGVFAASGAVLLFYSAAFGTIEEQFLYFLILPAILSLVIVGPGLARWVLEWRPRRHAERRVVSATRVRALCVSVLAVVAVWNGAVWVHGRVTTTNQLAQLTRWMDQNIPRSATIAYPEGVIQFALEGNGFPAIPLGFPNVMAADHVRYLVVIPKEIQENYTFISPQSFVFFEAHSNVVFRSATSGGEYVEVLATTNPTTW